MLRPGEMKVIFVVQFVELTVLTDGILAKQSWFHERLDKVNSWETQPK